MSETNYSIDEVKLMAKVERYKRRRKELRNYSEYLERALTINAMQVQELKAEAAKWHDTALQLSANCGAAEAKIDILKARNAELETMVERLIEAGGAMVKNFVIYASLQGNEKPRSEAKKWYALVAEWKERKNE